LDYPLINGTYSDCPLQPQVYLQDCPPSRSRSLWPGQCWCRRCPPPSPGTPYTSQTSYSNCYSLESYSYHTIIRDKIAIRPDPCTFNTAYHILQLPSLISKTPEKVFPILHRTVWTNNEALIPAYYLTPTVNAVLNSTQSYYGTGLGMS
jgi:hypothetical protein